VGKLRLEILYTAMTTNDTPEQELDSDIEIDEHEVTHIIESIKEAQYFDASSMAPLTPASVVSIYCVSTQLRRGSDMFEGSYRQIEGV
jgi:hypothetical protein